MHRYPRVLFNALVVAAVFLALAAGAHLLDRKMASSTVWRVPRLARR